MHESWLNRFSGLRCAGKTAKAVQSSWLRCATPLKRGVNEMRDDQEYEHFVFSVLEDSWLIKF